MHDTSIGAQISELTEPGQPLSAMNPAVDATKVDVVSTHVLVEPEQIERLRELSKRTRIAQSEYLREAVDDLLAK